jgi:hypothetical protein
VLDTQLYFGGDPTKDKFVNEKFILKPVIKHGIKVASFDIGLEDYRDFGEDYMLRDNS